MTIKELKKEMGMERYVNALGKLSEFQGKPRLDDIDVIKVFVVRLVEDCKMLLKNLKEDTSGIPNFRQC